jgi:hypothetical protein
MGKYVNRITHKGKEILFLDAANKGEQECVAAWEEMKRELSGELNGCLMLVDATNVQITLAITNKAREAGSSLKRNPRNRIAFIATSTLLKSTAQIHSRAFGLKALFCDKVEVGKEWLVSEDEKS